jgi:hypothetical protein
VISSLPCCLAGHGRRRRRRRRKRRRRMRSNGAAVRI